MKIRMGFVSNSSSSSCLVINKSNISISIESLCREVIEYIQNLTNDSDSEESNIILFYDKRDIKHANYIEIDFYINDTYINDRLTLLEPNVEYVAEVSDGCILGSCLEMLLGSLDNIETEHFKFTYLENHH